MPQPPLPRLSNQVQVATQEENKDMAKLQLQISDLVMQHRKRLHTQMIFSVSESVCLFVCLLFFLFGQFHANIVFFTCSVVVYLANRLTFFTLCPPVFAFRGYPGRCLFRAL